MDGNSPPHSSVDDYHGGVLGTPFSASVMEPDAPPAVAAPTDSAVLPNGEGEGEGGASLAIEDFDATPAPGSAPGPPNHEGGVSLSRLTPEDLRAGLLTPEDLRAPSVASSVDAAHPMASLQLPDNRARQEQLLARLQKILPGQKHAHGPLGRVLLRAIDHVANSRGMSPSVVGHQKMLMQSFVVVGQPGVGKTTFGSNLSRILNPDVHDTQGNPPYFFTSSLQNVSRNPGQTMQRWLADAMREWIALHHKLTGPGSTGSAPIPVIFFDEADRANESILTCFHELLGEGHVKVGNEPVTLPPNWAVIVVWATNCGDQYLGSPEPTDEAMHSLIRSTVKRELRSKWLKMDSLVRRVFLAADDAECLLLLFPHEGERLLEVCRSALNKISAEYQIAYGITLKFGAQAEHALAQWPKTELSIYNLVRLKVLTAIRQRPPGETCYLHFTNTDVIVTTPQRILEAPFLGSHLTPAVPSQHPESVPAGLSQECPSLEQWEEYAVKHNEKYWFPISEPYLKLLCVKCRCVLPEKFDTMSKALKRAAHAKKIEHALNLKPNPTVCCQVKGDVYWFLVEDMRARWIIKLKPSVPSSPPRGNPHVPIRPSHTSPSATARSQRYFSPLVSSPTSEASFASPSMASPPHEAVTSIDSGSSSSSVDQTETRSQTLGSHSHSYSYSSDQLLPSSLVQDLQLQSLPLSPSSQMETDQPLQSHEPNPSKAGEEFVKSLLEDGYWSSPSSSSSSSSLHSDHDTLTPVASSRLAETEDVEMTDATVAAPPAPSTVATVSITPQAEINDSVIMLPPSFHRTKPSVVNDDDDDDDDDESPMERSFCHSPDDSDEETASHCETSSVTSHASSEASIESLGRSLASTDVESLAAELESIQVAETTTKRRRKIVKMLRKVKRILKDLKRLATS